MQPGANTPRFRDKLLAQFKPEKAWQGKSALVPVETCYKILDLTLWLACPPMIVAAILLQTTARNLLSTQFLFWLLIALLVPMVLAAICRAWNFNLRFALLAGSLFIALISIAVVAAVTPNWTLQVALLVALMTLFYGARAGLFTIALVILCHVPIAWAWIDGTLPTALFNTGAKARYMDFSLGLVWVRVVGLSTGLLVVFVINARSIFWRMKQNELFKQSIIDSMREHIAVLDDKGVIISVNKPWLNFAAENSAHTANVAPLVGLGVNYLDTCRRSAANGSADAQHVYEGIVAVIEGRQTHFNYEYRCDSFEAHRWFLMSVTPLDEHRSHVVISHLDISEQRAAERALEESEEEFRTMFELASIGMAEADPETGRFRRVNKKLCSITGFCVEELLQKSFSELTHQEDKARDWEIFQKAKSSGSSEYHLNKRYVHKNGALIYANVNVAMIRDSAGVPKQIVASVEDVTERHRAETLLLRNQRLEAIGTLSSGIAHDLNNILAPMLMASGVLRSTLTEERDRELMGLIERAARRGAEIIRQLLTFSKGIEGERVLVQMRHLIKEMAGIARETFPRNITVIESADKEVWPVIADATQLHQVLMNLCVNARDAMPEGGELRIGARNVELTEKDLEPGFEMRPGPKVLFTVEDTGEGIPREIIDKIFEPFFTTKPLSKGTGLGLSTVLGIIRSHGGAITVNSTPRQGTQFGVYLTASPVITKTNSDPKKQETVKGQGETILLVDDEESILKTLKMALNDAGYQVLSAKNGQEALQVFVEHQQEIKLVVTDVMMPVMDGLKLARVLHELDQHILVIASSGLDPEEKKAELAAGFIVDFLNKPVEIESLLRSVHTHLGTINP